MQFKTEAEARAYDLGLRQRASHPIKEASPVFKKNALGQDEYASIHIVMDHLMDSDSDHKNTKLVLSTEEPEAALRSLWDYYGESANLSSLKSTLDLLVEHRLQPKGIFLYVTPADVGDRFGGLRLEVIMGTDLFAALTAHASFGAGSEFVLIEALKEQFAKIMSDIRVERGGFPPLTYIGMEGQLIVSKSADNGNGTGTEVQHEV